VARGVSSGRMSDVIVDCMETALYSTLAAVVDLAFPILVWALVIAGLVTVVRDKQAEGNERRRPTIVLQKLRRPRWRRSPSAERRAVPLQARR
jgi:hypothetical protein